jgi:hypothetical protein
MASLTAARLKGEVLIKVPSNRGADLCVHDTRVTEAHAIKALHDRLARNCLLGLAGDKKNEGKQQQVSHV